MCLPEPFPSQTIVPSLFRWPRPQILYLLLSPVFLSHLHSLPRKHCHNLPNLPLLGTSAANMLAPAANIYFVDTSNCLLRFHLILLFLPNLNSTGRFIILKQGRAHGTRVLKSYHWLPTFRVKHKMLVMAFKDLPHLPHRISGLKLSCCPFLPTHLLRPLTSLIFL